MFTIGNIALGGGGNFSNSVRKPTSNGECPKTFATDCGRQTWLVTIGADFYLWTSFFISISI